VAKHGMLYRLRRGLADLLAPEREEQRPRRRPVPRAVVAAPPAPSAFEDRLKAMLVQSGQGALFSGRINFIGLQKVKERFGAGWERIADRADHMARNIIERHLAQGDIFTSVDSLTYVMVFARLTADQAKVKCRAIADEIAMALLGEKGGDLLEVKTAVTHVDGTLHFETISLTDQLCASLEGAEDLEFIEAAEAPPEPRRAPPRGRDLLANFRAVYRPIWDRSHNVVSAYLCAAQILSADGASVLGDAEALVEDDVDECARLDGKLCRHVLRDLAALTREGRQLLLTLPVHFETLSAAGRRRDYLAALGRDLPDGAGKYLMMEVAGVPAGAPQSRLIEITATLRRLCRGFMLSLPVDVADFANVKGCGAAAIGCDIAHISCSEAALMQYMNRFARAAEKAGIPSYLHGARSLSRVVVALGAGFNYIDGGAVASPIEHPRGIVDFRLDDLYRAFLRH